MVVLEIDALSFAVGLGRPSSIDIYDVCDLET